MKAEERADNLIAWLENKIASGEEKYYSKFHSLIIKEMNLHAESLSKTIHSDTEECWDIYLTEMGIGLKERNLILKRLSVTPHAKRVSDTTPNRIQISEKKAEECVSKIISSGWVDIKNRHMVELTIRNSMSDYHTFLSHNKWLSKTTEGEEKTKKTVIITYKHFRTIENKRLKLSREEFVIWLSNNYDIERQPLPPPPVKKEKEKRNEVPLAKLEALLSALRDIRDWDDDLEDEWEDAGYRAIHALKIWESKPEAS